METDNLVATTLANEIPDMDDSAIDSGSDNGDDSPCIDSPQ